MHGHKKFDARFDIILAWRNYFQERNCIGKLGKNESFKRFEEDYNAKHVAIEDLVRAEYPTVSWRSLQRWVLGSEKEGVLTICDRRHVKGAKVKSQIEAHPGLEKAVIAILTEKNHIKSSHLVDIINHARIDKENGEELWPQISYSAVCRYRRKFEENNAQALLAETNPDAWKNKYLSSLGKLDGDVIRLNQRWEMDGTPADWEFVDGRYTASVVLDIFGRRPMIRFSKTPRTETNKQLTRAAILKWGVPEQIKTDMWSGLFVLSLALIACGDSVMASPLLLDSPAGGLVMLGFAGLIVDKATIANVFISLKTTFQNAFDAAPSTWEKIAMKVPSTSSKNDYSWLSNFPKMRRWVGEKFVKSLKAYNYSVINDDWEATIEVKRNDIEDDQLAGYAVQAQSAGQSAKQLPDEIVIELVNGGFTALCYDGQYFFDTDHDVAGASVSNKLTVALSAATFAAAKASYGAARAAMGKFKDDEGRPLNVTTSVLLVPKALEDDANLLMTASTFEDGKPNIYKGTAEVVCDARLPVQTPSIPTPIKSPISKQTTTLKDGSGNTDEITEAQIESPTPAENPTGNPNLIKITEITTKNTYNTSNVLTSTTTTTTGGTEQPQPQSFEIDIDNMQDQPLEERVIPGIFAHTSWGSGSCPGDRSVSYHYGTLNLTFQPACDATIALQPLVVILAGIAALFIISGAVRND